MSCSTLRIVKPTILTQSMSSEFSALLTFSRTQRKQPEFGHFFRALSCSKCSRSASALIQQVLSFSKRSRAAIDTWSRRAAGTHSSVTKLLHIFNSIFYPIMT